jgi:hypothetical protein
MPEKKIPAVRDAGKVSNPTYSKLNSRFVVTNIQTAHTISARTKKNV